jgi:hypothetical protein
MALDIAVGADEYLHLNSPFFIHRHKGNRPDAAGSKWPLSVGLPQSLCPA